MKLIICCTTALVVLATASGAFAACTDVDRNNATRGTARLEDHCGSTNAPLVPDTRSTNRTGERGSGNDTNAPIAGTGNSAAPSGTGSSTGTGTSTSSGQGSTNNSLLAPGTSGSGTR
jgi:hypothetical protein